MRKEPSERIIVKIKQVATHFLLLKDKNVCIMDELSRINPLILEIALFLDCSPEQAAFFSIYFYKTVNDEDTGIKDIAGFMKATAFDILEYAEIIDDMANKGLLISHLDRGN